MLTGRDRTFDLAEAVGQHGTDDKNAACNGHRSDVSPQIMAANTGLRIGSMPEVNAAVTGETASSPRDRQMVARPVCTVPRSTITSHMDGVWMVSCTAVGRPMMKARI